MTRIPMPDAWRTIMESDRIEILEKRLQEMEGDIGILKKIMTDMAEAVRSILKFLENLR